MSFDVLAIGDTTIDAFIKLTDAVATCDEHGEHCKLCLRYADKVPYESVEVLAGVGNSANAAVACARLGLSSALRAYVGDDREGTECIEYFKSQHVDTSLVERAPGVKTNYHYVLWYKADRTILIKHERYAYAMPATTPEPKWVYLSSMADNSLEYHKEIATYLMAHPGVKVAFQPGTFQMKLGVDVLKDIYARSEILFCNKEESQRILKTQEDDVKKLLEGIRALGPKLAVITDGPSGLSASDGNEQFHLPMYPDPKPPVERTGAGDATSSTTVAYLEKGLSLQEALKRGLINSASVVQHVGAQKGLLSAEEIEEWYVRRPAHFVAAPLS
ncbi:MAG: carbohydrate kinase family protein [Candidatus Kaiserbacteria bacterium]|nr:MAG: carbohydrate kinase family protein [Candidatus Kaiserbacteria bacterium]